MSNPIPAPAIIDGVEWTVRDSGDPRTAYVDFSKKTMVVPMDDTPTGNMIRAHETAHVAITPRDLDELKRLAAEFPNRTLQACEDCRVYVSLQLAGVDTDASHWRDKDIAKVSSLGDSPQENEEKTNSLVATMGTGDYDKLAKVLPAKNVEDAERLYAEFFASDVASGKLPEWGKTVAMARKLHSLYDASYTPPTETEPGDSEDSEESESDGSEGKSEGEFKGEESEDSDGEGKPSKPTPVDPSKARPVTRPFVPGDIEDSAPTPSVKAEEATAAEKRELVELGIPWSRMGTNPIHDSLVEFRYPPLRVHHKGRKGFGNRKVSSDTGSVPRRLGRYAVDSAVFSKTVKKGFGTVLVDVSGSMGFTLQCVDDIIDRLPNTTVAIYSGDGRTGHVTVVAKEGKRVDKVPPFPGGNVVDTQALEWLARQRAPRAWICDGVVTGEGDGILSTTHCLKIVRICKLASIKRYRRIEDLLKGVAASKATSY